MKKPLNYDAEFCGRIPLHQTNLIQPHGALLVVGMDSRLPLLQASENAASLLGGPVPEAIGQSLAEFLAGDTVEPLQQWVSSGGEGRLPLSLRFSRSGQALLAYAKRADGYFMLEVDLATPAFQESTAFLQSAQELRNLMVSLEETGTVEEASTIALKELKRLSGFDKLMMYRFDGDWNGTVIAEVAEEGMEAYLGLKFPASDVPRTARELYRLNPYRFIPDTEYTPVRLYPVLNPITSAFTDLSHSNLRSVAGVHLEYLRNMGVRASMSTRVLRDEALWGLISCHHRTPRVLTAEQCALFEIVSGLISARLAALDYRDAYAFRSAKSELHGRLVESFFREQDLAYAFHQHAEEILSLLGAGGLALVYRGRTALFGRTPEAGEVEDLVVWLRSAYGGQRFAHPSLSTVFEPALSYTEPASGLLSLPIEAERETFLLAFRPEEIQEVSWGGNPNEAVHFDPGGGYHPRNSFRLWQQTVSGTARPWTPLEEEVAETFRNFLIEYTLNKVYP